MSHGDLNRFGRNYLRSEQEADRLDETRAGSPGAGFEVIGKCPICGGYRGKGRDHSRCSRKLQQQAAERRK